MLCSMQSVTSMPAAQADVVIDSSVRTGGSMQGVTSMPTACGT